MSRYPYSTCPATWYQQQMKAMYRQQQQQPIIQQMGMEPNQRIVQQSPLKMPGMVQPRPVQKNFHTFSSKDYKALIQQQQQQQRQEHKRSVVVQQSKSPQKARNYMDMKQKQTGKQLKLNEIREKLEMLNKEIEEICKENDEEEEEGFITYPTRRGAIAPAPVMMKHGRGYTYRDNYDGFDDSDFISPCGSPPRAILFGIEPQNESYVYEDVSLGRFAPPPQTMSQPMPTYTTMRPTFTRSYHVPEEVLVNEVPENYYDVPQYSTFQPQRSFKTVRSGVTIQPIQPLHSDVYSFAGGYHNFQPFQ